MPPPIPATLGVWRARAVINPAGREERGVAEGGKTRNKNAVTNRAVLFRMVGHTLNTSCQRPVHHRLPLLRWKKGGKKVKGVSKRVVLNRQPQHSTSTHSHHKAPHRPPLGSNNDSFSKMTLKTHKRNAKTESCVRGKMKGGGGDEGANWQCDCFCKSLRYQGIVGWFAIVSAVPAVRPIMDRTGDSVG